MGFLRRLALTGVVVGAAYWLWPAGELRHRPGVLVAGEPRQAALGAFRLGPVEGCTLNAVATYDVTARILHTKRYWSDQASRLAPVDVALGWGPMSDQSVLDTLDISQTNRFFFYAWEGAPPLDPDIIKRHAANVHIIAASPAVARSVKSLRVGELVAMSGYLVNVEGPEGFRWNSSLTREDTGNGACELFYVTALEKKEARK